MFHKFKKTDNLGFSWSSPCAWKFQRAVPHVWQSLNFNHLNIYWNISYFFASR